MILFFQNFCCNQIIYNFTTQKLVIKCIISKNRLEKMMTTINEFPPLSEEEKLILGIVSDLSKKEKDPITKELTISETLKITLTGEGIKKLKMISEKDLDSDSIIQSLITKKFLIDKGIELKLTNIGEKVGRQLRTKKKAIGSIPIFFDVLKVKHIQYSVNECLVKTYTNSMFLIWNN